MKRRKSTLIGLTVGLAALALVVGGLGTAYAAAIPGGSLDPSVVPKYVSPLVKPPVMPQTKLPNNMGKKIKQTMDKNIEYYEIAVKQFDQQILPTMQTDMTPIPPTTVWSYGPADDFRTVAEGGRFFYPAFTIEAKYNKPVRVKWINGLVDADGNYLSHLLPVDPTLHWANPPGGLDGRDTRPEFDSTPGPYLGPVPIVTHVHGAHTNEDSDGYPEAWYLPVAENIPMDLATTGTFFDYFRTKYQGSLSWVNEWPEDGGFAVFQYPNDQRATTLWYHDHTLGMTRLNVYAGPAGFYLIRGGPADMVLDSRDGTPAILPSPRPGPGVDPFGTFYEIPIAIQDRSFNGDGSLFYPDSREFFDEFDGPFIPDSDSPVSPIWNPEFFGNMMVVNGQTWPFLDVTKQRYRLRLLNGCNSRFLILDFSDIPGVEVSWIGTEGGFLPAPVDVTTDHDNRILLGPAERADIIVDFANVPTGNYVLKNIGPDEPFKGFNSDGTLADGEGDVLPASDSASTGQVMEFRVAGGAVVDPTTPPEFLQLPTITPLGATDNTQFVSLNEEVYEPEDVPFAALLGTYDETTGTPTPLLWMDGITENPDVGDTEEWRIRNFTEDAHPIHIHLVQFEVVGREVVGGGTSNVGQNAPLPWETGHKDTVIAYPGEDTVVKAKFDYPGFFVWHCHIVEHEDNEMMRPYHVGPIPVNAPAQ